MCRCNMLAKMAESESINGGWRKDHLITLLDAMTPLMKLLRRHMKENSNAVATDAELGTEWVSLQPEFIHPPGRADGYLPPEEDLISMQSHGITNKIINVPICFFLILA